jgi:dTDP-4-dehydrorhamnose 3,5-epimerase-like enzyme
MDFKPLGIEGAWVAESTVWDDNRGFFREWFKHDEIFASTGLDFAVKQANFSLSNQCHSWNSLQLKAGRPSEVDNMCERFST